MSEQMKSDANKKGALNVVPLRPEPQEAALEPVVLTRMPATMHLLRDKARQQLQSLLRELFDKVDDAMFELADKAASNVEQNVYFDSMREVRIRRRSMEASFFRFIDVRFAQLLDLQATRDKEASVASLSLDDLSLVKNDELEEIMATESMINRVNERCAEAIQHLTLRIDQLVPVKVYQKNNPLGVDAICQAFAEATRALSIDVKAKLVLFKLFDNLVMVKLDNLFEQLNQLLIDAHILPSLKTTGINARQGRPAAGRSGGSATWSGAGYGATGGHVGKETGGLVYDEQTNQLISHLRELMGNTQRSHGLPGAAELPTHDLLQLLSRAQHSYHREQHYSHDHGHITQPQPLVNLRQLLGEVLHTANQSGVQHAINSLDEDVINLVGMLFEFILDDRNLAAPMKALIGRLQIPLVKVAVADKTFFSKGGHPARRLLNEMATAALGWQESPEEMQRKDGLYQRMQMMVNSILTDFDDDLGLFEPMLLEFRAYLDKEQRRAKILEQRILDAEDGKAKSEKARSLVNAELKRLGQGRELPAAASSILQEAWANVMFICCLRDGVDSTAWKDCCTTAQQLVWSVSTVIDAQNRQVLLKLVPELLQKLRVGLESISFSPFETAQLFKQLEAIHLARLRGAAVAPAETAPVLPSSPSHSPDVAPVTVASAPPVLAEQAPAQQPVPPLAPPPKVSEKTSFVLLEEPQPEPIAAADPQHMALVGNITQGTWFEMQGAQGEKFRCRLAAVIRSVNKYIFVNRAGIKVAEESRESLSLALQHKRLTILDDGMLFDRALESVITNLREQRPSQS